MHRTLQGVRAYSLIWVGQVVSIFGSGLSRFAVGLWVYERTGSVTLFALIAMATMLPGIILSPVAGTLVDRLDRRLVLLGCNAGAALCTALITGLFAADSLALWHLYLILTLQGIFQAVELPALSALPTLLIPGKNLARVGGMLQVGISTAQMLSPVAAGWLMVRGGLPAVFCADFASFLIALLSLLFVRIPRPKSTGQGARRSFTADMAFGWNYLRRRPGMLGLLGIMTAGNFTISLALVVLTPMVLHFASPEELAQVLSVTAFGRLGGGLLISAWGGPRRRVAGILIFNLATGLLLTAAGFAPSAALVGAAMGAASFFDNMIVSTNQAVWQSRVESALQGRVFGIRYMIARAAMPLAQLLAGPLSDQLFEPLLAHDGPLAASVGALIGAGPGRGMGLLIITLGVATSLASVWGYSSDSLRALDDEPVSEAQTV